MSDPVQSEFWIEDSVEFDEQAAERAYRKRKKLRPLIRPTVEFPQPEAGADLGEQLIREFQRGRREGLGTCCKALRACIDARFRLPPEEFDYGELPEGLDVGELLDAMNSLLIEYGRRSFGDGFVAGQREDPPEEWITRGLRPKPDEEDEETEEE